MQPFLRATGVLAFAGLVATPLLAQAPQPAGPPLSLQEQIPLDAAVRTGTANGLRYFIRENGRPKSEWPLRLAVKAGSLSMRPTTSGDWRTSSSTWRSTEGALQPGRTRVVLLETHGAPWSARQRHTSFDETVYMLDLPTDSTEVVSKGLQALAPISRADSRSARKKSTRNAASSSRNAWPAGRVIRIA